MLKFMTGEQIVALTTGSISAKKQQGPISLDLTVNEIRKIDQGGALDFGGSEFQEASTTLLKPEKKSPEEPYGWWNLKQGQYLIKFNEKFNLKNQALILVIPHGRLLTAGGSHPCVIEDPDKDIRILLSVGIHGLSIKENARVSQALVLAASL